MTVSRCCHIVVGGLVASCVLGAQDVAPTDEAIVDLVNQAERLRPLIVTASVQQLLDEVGRLPAIKPRTLWRRSDPLAALTDEQYQALPESEREGWRRMEFDTRRYYVTFYGTPLASMRAYDLAAGAGGYQSYEDRHVLDIGYGSIGQLRLLGQRGAHAVGVEVEPLLHVLYSFPGDRGTISVVRGRAGTVRLVHGYWPRDVRAEVGEGYDLIISKNTLKKGYVTPDEPDPRNRGVDLSVSPAEYVRALAGAVHPGGLVMIYNIGPAPGPDGRGVDEEGRPTYIHMADIRCPFPRATWERAGFEILAFDEPDSAMIRRFAAAFGWDDPEVMGQGVMDLEKDLFASYTLVRKRMPNDEAEGGDHSDMSP